MNKFVQSHIVLYFFLVTLGVSGFFFTVVWPHTVGFYAFIVLASAGGFGVATYIRHAKYKGEHLVCPTGSDCDAVITSRYATFLGVSLEYWGLLYYGTIFLSYITLIFAPHLFSASMMTALITLTAVAFVFSLYLLFVQAFLLRRWCIWCLLSALLSTGIFIFSLTSVDFALELLAHITTVIEAVGNAGFVIGLGGAVTAVFLFFEFLRNLDIDEKELKTIEMISELVWSGLVLTLVSQLFSYVANAEGLVQSGSFLIQTLSLLVVAVSGAALMIIFAPFLAVIPFGKSSEDKSGMSLTSLRRPLFIVGSITFISWVFAFAMEYVPDYGSLRLLLAYIVVLAVSITTAIYIEKRIDSKALEE